MNFVYNDCPLIVPVTLAWNHVWSCIHNLRATVSPKAVVLSLVLVFIEAHFRCQTNPLSTYVVSIVGNTCISDCPASSPPSRIKSLQMAIHVSVTVYHHHQVRYRLAWAFICLHILRFPKACISSCVSTVLCHYNWLSRIFSHCPPLFPQILPVVTRSEFPLSYNVPQFDDCPKKMLALFCETIFSGPHFLCYRLFTNCPGFTLYVKTGSTLHVKKSFFFLISIDISHTLFFSFDKMQ